MPGLHRLILFSSLLIIGIFTYMVVMLFDRGSVVFTDLQTYTGPVVLAENPYFGSTNPELRLVMYSNFTCANCADFSRNVIAAIEGRNVTLIWKDLPNDSLHTLSTQASLAAHCAGEQHRFWQYHDALMSHSGEFDPETLLQIADDLQLRPRRFARCLDKQIPKSIIDQSVDEATQLNVTLAPTLYIEKDRYATGQIITDDLAQKLDSLLAL